MKLPRDLSGVDLARALERYAYRTTRQTGSHLRLAFDQTPAFDPNDPEPVPEPDLDPSPPDHWDA